MTAFTEAVVKDPTRTWLEKLGLRRPTIDLAEVRPVPAVLGVNSFQGIVGPAQSIKSFSPAR